MNINTDVSFVTGVTHKVCQDYARKGQGYVLISDGCSSSQDSDFGSRMLVKAAENLILAKSWNARDAVVLAAHDVQNMKLSEDCLDATLMMAEVDGDKVNIRVYGDGYIFIKRHDGSIVIHEINFPSNYPFYLNYLRNEERLTLIGQTYFDAKSFRKITQHKFGPNFTDQKTDVMEFGFGADSCELDFSQSLENIDIIALMSDGVGSFYDKVTQKGIPALDVIKELCAFKGTNGEAVTRRMAAFFRDVAKKNWAHADDISLGAIFVGD